MIGKFIKRVFSPASAMLMWALAGYACGTPFAGAAVGVNPPAAPEHLQTQLRTKPLAINSVHPEFGWVLPWKGRGQLQTAYRIQVASSARDLLENKGNLWDSGKVISGNSIAVQYAGSALVARQQCFWKVRVWNQSDKASPWSTIGVWQEGLLTAGAWHHAQWIGLPVVANSQAAALSNAQWIWYPEGQPAQSAPVGKRFFRRVILLPANNRLAKGTIAMTADNAFELRINGRPVEHGDNFNHVYTSNIMPFLHAGRNVIKVIAENAGTSPNPAGLIGNIHLVFADGKTVNLPTDAFWRASRHWSGSWTGAMALGQYGIGPWGQLANGYQRSLPARYLRRDFMLTKPVARALVYFSGLGWSKLYINGHVISKDQLSPALSWYPKRCYYRTYDVTQYLVHGRNTIGVILGNGRFYAPRLHTPTGTIGFGAPRLMLQLHIRLKDGSTQLLRSNAKWKAIDNGPITANNEYDGETYDLRKRMPGWSRPGFDASAWSAAAILQSPGGRLISQFSQPIQVTRIVHPVKVVRIGPDKWMFDMGQNMAGWCQIRVPSGPAGTKIVLRHGESLTRNGRYTVDLRSGGDGRLHLFVANLRSAKQTDTLILNGKGPVTWHPIFTTHGFRFVELIGYPGIPTLSTLEGQEVHDALPTIGDFSCSDPLVNKIFHNWQWGTKNNYRSIPSDCPQRDERQGWMGDRSEESQGETFVFNNERFYQMWLDDMQDGQQSSGSISDVNPPYWPFYNNNVTWPSTFIFLPCNLYKQFGQLSVIRTHYAAEKRWVNMELGFVHHGITTMDSYGDWCSPSRSPAHIHSRDQNRATPGPLLASVTLYQDLKLMGWYASLLHKPVDQTHWLSSAASIKAGINRQLWNSSKHYYGNGSDTSCILPLAAGIVPSSRRAAVITRLLYRIDSVQHGHVGTGLIGGQWLFRTLTRIGQAQIAWNMLNKTSYPGWGFMIDHGATTIWELWNGNTASPAMNSQDHVMLIGDMITWLFEDIGGIKSDRLHPGFHHIIMRPLVVHGLQWVNSWHRSPYGKIVSNWKIAADGIFHWHIQIPADCVATVEIPTTGARAVRLNGRRFSNTSWIKLLRYKHGRAVYSVESGIYDFSAQEMR